MSNEEGNEYRINNTNMSRQIEEMISKGVCVVCRQHNSLVNTNGNTTQCRTCNTKFVKGGSS